MAAWCMVLRVKSWRLEGVMQSYGVAQLFDRHVPYHTSSKLEAVLANLAYRTCICSDNNRLSQCRALRYGEGGEINYVTFQGQWLEISRHVNHCQMFAIIVRLAYRVTRSKSHS